jgi:cob(I)alamin adenosyltransferase
MTKIYTKTGDKGLTSLFNGKRVSKSNDLIGIVGKLDELNSEFGLVISLFDKPKDKTKADILNKNLVSLLNTQSQLFEIGSEVAYPSKHGNINLNKEINNLEDLIDEMELKLTPLTNFILPSGSVLSAQIHRLRTQVRSFERLIISKKKMYYNQSVNVYINRLSDYLFVLARFINHQKGVKETIWKSK